MISGTTINFRHVPLSQLSLFSTRKHVAVRVASQVNKYIILEIKWKIEISKQTKKNLSQNRNRLFVAMALLKRESSVIVDGRRIVKTIVAIQCQVHKAPSHAH